MKTVSVKIIPRPTGCGSNSGDRQLLRDHQLFANHENWPWSPAQMHRGLDALLHSKKSGMTLFSRRGNGGELNWEFSQSPLHSERCQDVVLPDPARKNTRCPVKLHLS